MTRKPRTWLGWIGLPLVIAGIVALAVTAVHARRDQGSADDSPPPSCRLDGDCIVVDRDAVEAAALHEMKIEPRAVPTTLTLTGRTGLDMDVVTHVHAQFGGKVIDAGPELGSLVKGPGEPGGPSRLCVIESNDLAQAKAAWIQADVQLRLDNDALSRTRELVNSTVLAPKFLIDAESAVTRDRAAIEAARQQLLIFGLNAKQIDDVRNQVGRQRMDYVITSPRSGVIAEKGVAGGDIADPSLNLFTIADTSKIRVWGDVYERDLHWIRVGEPARVFFTSDPEHPRDCTIEWISPELDPNTHSIRIRATLDNRDGRLLADMYGTIVVTVGAGDDSIVVPAEAVVRTDSDSQVFVRQGEDAEGARRYRRTAVQVEPTGVGFGASGAASSAIGTVARNSGESASGSGALRVTRGLKPGDVIVTAGALGLSDEMDQLAGNR